METQVSFPMRSEIYNRTKQFIDLPQCEQMYDEEYSALVESLVMQ